MGAAIYSLALNLNPPARPKSDFLRLSFLTSNPRRSLFHEPWPRATRGAPVINIAAPVGSGSFQDCIPQAYTTAH